jgi:hypothetical protein
MIKGFGLAFLLPILVLVVSIVWVGFSVVSKNLLAKDVVFAYTALVAALMMFVLNLFFSLQTTKIEKVIYPHITHSEQCLDIFADQKSSFVVQKRDEISKGLNIPYSLNPFSYSDIADKSFTKDVNEFIRICIVGSMLRDCSDWSSQEVRFRGLVTRSFISKKHHSGDNSFFTTDEIINRLNLRVTIDIFKSLIVEGLTLPPETVIHGALGGFFIDNPFVNVEIRIELAPRKYRGAFRYDEGVRMETLNRSSMDDVVSYDASIALIATYKAQRQGHSRMKLYTNWVDGLAEYLAKSFSPVNKHFV